MRTRLLKAGKDRIVRIPRELTFGSVAGEVDSDWLGDALVIRPIRTATRKSLAGVVKKFRAFSQEFSPR